MTFVMDQPNPYQPPGFEQPLASDSLSELPNTLSFGLSLENDLAAFDDLLQPVLKFRHPPKTIWHTVGLIAIVPAYFVGLVTMAGSCFIYDSMFRTSSFFDQPTSLLTVSIAVVIILAIFIVPIGFAKLICKLFSPPINVSVYGANNPLVEIAGVRSLYAGLLNRFLVENVDKQTLALISLRHDGCRVFRQNRNRDLILTAIAEGQSTFRLKSGDNNQESDTDLGSIIIEKGKVSLHMKSSAVKTFEQQILSVIIVLLIMLKFTKQSIYNT